MKKFYLLPVLLGVLPTAGLASENVTVHPLGAVKPARITASFNVADVLVNENFEYFEDGTPENPEISIRSPEGHPRRCPFSFPQSQVELSTSCQ